MVFFCLFVHLFVFAFGACGILVPRPGIKAVPPAVKAQSLNHWTAREVPDGSLETHNESMSPED